MNQHEKMILSELNTASAMTPSMQVEHTLADIKDTFQTAPLAKIPFTEIAGLGGAFSGLAKTLCTPSTKGLYRCVFPEGVTGKLAQAKDGSGALGTIINEKGIAGQARWLPAEENVIGPSLAQTALVAVAVLAVVKQINDIKDGQKEIIGILERDKKSQLLEDYDILSSYMSNYKYYWENETELLVNLNQVKNIKRNAKKDIRSYTEQIENHLAAKKNLLKTKTASQKIGDLLNRFIHYKLALHVFALSEYMEVMLSKNFQAEYLEKIAQGIRDNDYRFRKLYSQCYDKIEAIRNEAVTSQAAKKASEAAKGLGDFIGKIPVVKQGPVDEFFVGLGNEIGNADKKRLEKSLAFFMQYKDSGLPPVADHIDTINQLANKPVVMLYNDNTLCFKPLQEVG